jgi:hypothetical protein
LPLKEWRERISNEQAARRYKELVRRRQHQTGAPAPKGRPGRRITTADIARNANDLKAQGKTWVQIHATCESQFPGRVTSLEQVRTIWRRRFGGKK